MLVIYFLIVIFQNAKKFLFGLVGMFTLFTSSWVAADAINSTDFVTRTVSLVAADGGGNTPPVGYITNTGSIYTGVTSVTMTFTGSDNGGIETVECSLDGKTRIDCERFQLGTPIVGYHTFTGLTTGGYIGYVRLTDDKGMISIIEYPFTINPIVAIDMPPVVTLRGSSTVTIMVGSGRTDPGATWIDVVDATGAIVAPTSGSVNLTVPGTYILSYTYIDTARNPGNIVTRTVIVQQKSSGGGGGGWTTPKDICPDGDYSPSYYDGSCGILPTTGTVDETTFNPSIGKTCFTPLNKNTIDQGIQVSDAFKIAHQMIYSYELTRWQGTRDYRPFDYLTREEAARFMVEFAENVLCRTKTRTYTDNFSDLSSGNPSLTPFIKSSYEYNIFNGDKIEERNSTTFRPSDRITKDEFAAIMVRMVTNTILEEPQDDWSAPYILQLVQYSKFSRLNDRGRGNIAEVMYDLYRNNTYILQDVGYVIQ